MRKLFIALLAVPALLWGQDSLNVTRVAQLNYWDYATSVAVSGSHAYVCTDGSGLRVLDISNPEEPEEIGFYDPPGTVLDLVLFGDYVVLISGGDFGNPTRLRVVDVSNPMAPEEVGYLQTNAFNQFSLSGNFLYCAGFWGMEVIDLTNPLLPVEIGSFYAEGDYSTSVVVDSNYAYFVGDVSGFHVLDISTPSAPTEVAGMAFDYYGRMFKSGDLIYIALDGEEILIVDVSDPTNPEIVEHNFYAYDVQDIVVIDSLAYIAGNNSTLSIVDISDLLFPVEIGSLQLPGYFERIFVANDFVYVASGSSGLRIVNISNPAAPVEAGSYAYFGYLQGLTLYGNLAYTANFDYGLRVIDISNPTLPEEIAIRDTPGTARSVTIVGQYAYVADTYSGIIIFDISEPRNPVCVDTFDVVRFVSKIHIAGNYVYVVIGSGGLAILDISNPVSPIVIGLFSTDGHAMDVTVVDTLTFLVDLIGLKILDTSDPAEPELIGEFVTEGPAYEGLAYAVAVQGNVAYVAAEDAGLRVIDISNLAAPVEIGSIDTPGEAFGLLVSGNRAFVGDRSGGLRIMDISNPSAPYEVGYYNTPGSTWRMDKRGNYIYIADGHYFGIYDVSAALSTPEHPNTIVTEFSLHPIYPNPFNNTANIAFDLPREVTGRLVVYDVLGRVTNTLYDGKLTAGSHQMQFNGNNLSSGTYFVSLESPTFTATQKAVLLK